jgi:hypothetical protein
MFYVLFMCKCVLPPGVNPIAVEKYIDINNNNVNMEWGCKEHRMGVIALHKCGKSNSQISELFKPLKITRKFVCRAIKRSKELLGVEDGNRSRCPKCVRTKAAIKRVRERIRRNPLRKRLLVPRAKQIAPIDVTPHQGRSTGGLR